MNYLIGIFAFISASSLADDSYTILTPSALIIETSTTSHSPIEAQKAAVRVAVAKAFTEGVVLKVMRETQGRVLEVICVEIEPMNSRFGKQLDSYKAFRSSIDSMAKAEGSDVTVVETQTCR
ncbi:MAG: hypothetical protein HYR96_04130 [Deltaproteobacteria bacterium]|nr:hypothetical protein [Deltaproteobacteria bacterium]MBI3295537.1 hypothetical protein [Deltaproteobacteria bacterium]